MVKNLVYNSRNITAEKYPFKNHAENEVRRLVPDLVFVKKLYIK